MLWYCNFQTTLQQSLTPKVLHFLPDDWGAFVKVLSKECYVVGKARMVVIEWGNSNVWHYLGCFARRIRVVSKCDVMVDTFLNMWKNLSTLAIFAQIQTTALSHYR